MDRAYREELSLDDLNLTWTCTNFTNRTLIIAIAFLRPSAISPKERSDTLIIDFPGHFMFLETATNKIMREGYRMQKNLPK